MFGRLIRLWHTVRWLRPVQLWGRLWFRLARPRHADRRAAPPVRRAAGRWILAAQAASMTGPTRFRFLAVERELGGPEGWNRADWPKLWLYNLHYFDDLGAQDAAARVAWHRVLIERWIAENPPGLGNGWEPYPTSLRIVNWVKWALAGNALEPLAVQSLAVQTRWLRRRLEVHLLGNHLWANAKALVFAGLFFDGDEARRWRQEGLALLRRELREQWLADGGHFERSPMYHATLSWDLLELVALSALFPGAVPDGDVAAWRAATHKALDWLGVLTHPDGDIAFFNDAAFGVAPRHAQLVAAARSLGIAAAGRDDAPLVALAPSGYFRLQAAAAVLIADCAPVGPDYLPGHAHADTLSFELSLGAHRVFVNGGTSLYDVGAERLRQRGTAAHNTVQVDGENSSEVWSSFRVARRARPIAVAWGCATDGTPWLRGGHDGYRRLRGRPVHRREWQLGPRSLRVIDRVDGTFARAVARLRLHPAWRAHPDADARSGAVEGPGGRLTWRCRGAASARVVAGSWHPEFGVSLPCQVIEIGFVSAEMETTFEWI